MCVYVDVYVCECAWVCGCMGVRVGAWGVCIYLDVCMHVSVCMSVGVCM